ncbi:MAG: conjugal transfer protein TrbC [Rhizobiales bacterium]|nr:conjugal transfer protein TrbC [Hyphomicrobiales bacterium]
MTRSLIGAAALSFVAVAEAQAGASGLPWETPLQIITDSMSGPVLQSMLILAILVSGVMIAFTEVGAGAKRLLQAVFGLSIAAAAVSFFPAFFNFAGAATF